MTPSSEALIAGTPLCILDLETTGLTPGLDRVVEISIVRIEPDGSADLALDTLVDPERPMAGTELHGITDADVASAPTFRDLSAHVLAALDGAVLVSYNVYFDLRFLLAELAHTRQTVLVPHLCAMYLRPLLGVGKRCRLSAACEAHGIDHVGVHSAAGDALATAELIQALMPLMHGDGTARFDDLRRRGKKYKFLESLDFELPRWPSPASPCPTVSRVPAPDRGARPEAWRLREYQDALLVLLSDYSISPGEAVEAAELRGRLGLDDDQVRAVHARIFAATLNSWAADDRIDDREAEFLRALWVSLANLGWAPGGA